MLTHHTENSIALDIPFRGARDYAHSTDIFSALDNLAGRFLAPRAYVKSMTLRRKVQRQIAVQFMPHPEAFGTFTLALPNQTLEGWMIERGTPITRRVAFDENAIAREALVEPGRVFLTASLKGYSGFEQMIVLFKLLCTQSHPGNWLFTAIDLDRPLTAAAAIGVNRTQTVLDRLVDAALWQGGEPVWRAQMVMADGKDGRWA